MSVMVDVVDYELITTRDHPFLYRRGCLTSMVTVSYLYCRVVNPTVLTE